MEKLLNDQLLNLNGVYTLDKQTDVMLIENEFINDKQSEIEKGNLQDYLEIFGGDGNTY